MWKWSVQIIAEDLVSAIIWMQSQSNQDWEPGFSKLSSDGKEQFELSQQIYVVASLGAECISNVSIDFNGIYVPLIFL